MEDQFPSGQLRNFRVAGHIATVQLSGGIAYLPVGSGLPLGHDSHTINLSGPDHWCGGHTDRPHVHHGLSAQSIEPPGPDGTPPRRFRLPFPSLDHHWDQAKRMGSGAPQTSCIHRHGRRSSFTGIARMEACADLQCQVVSRHSCTTRDHFALCQGPTR